jgi:hypothetical protein
MAGNHEREIETVERSGSVMTLLVIVSIISGAAFTGFVIIIVVFEYQARHAAFEQEMNKAGKHDFRVTPRHNQLGTMICCYGCKDPEPDQVAYIWVDTDGTVYFDSSTPDELVMFMAHHDAFRTAQIMRKVQI